MYKRKTSVIIVAVATAILFGVGEATAKIGEGFHGGGGGGGFRGAGGGGGIRGGGWSGGGRNWGGAVPGRQGEFHGGDNIRPDHLRPNPPDHRIINRRHDNTNDINTGNTYNVTTDGDWDDYGAADEALAGMMFATTLGMVARSASQQQQQQQSSPSTVVVQPTPVVVVNNQQPGSAAPVIGSQTVTLPAGAQSQTVNGMLFYTCGSTWYKPYFGSSGVYYEVVQGPPQQ